MGVKAMNFKADLTNYEEVGDYRINISIRIASQLIIDKVRSLHATVIEKMGEPTILFNNAGLTLKSGIKSITEVSIEDFELTWRANCGSSFLMTQLCLPAMEKKGWGRIIFCSSVAAFNGGVVGPHYA